MPADRHGIAADRAVVDRIVDGVTAVLLVGPDEIELHVPVGELPPGAAEGVWLLVDHDSDPPTAVAVDRELTDRRAGDLGGRLDRIRKERSGGRFRA